jgi:hypothetical protein
MHIEKIRVRIMQEAYDLADRNDAEGYNSVKVMCSDVLALLSRREWVGLTEEEMRHVEETTTCLENESWLRNLTRNIEAKLKEKNT